ncbi:MAG: hypothetical protein QM487_08480 [Candidatus Marithrix sp.]
MSNLKLATSFSLAIGLILSVLFIPVTQAANIGIDTIYSVDSETFQPDVVIKDDDDS